MRSPRTARLGDVDPAGSRHLGRRSAVLVGDERVVAGTADGTVVAFDHGLTEQWRADGEGCVVSLAATAECLVAGERGVSGAVRAYDAATGAERWRYEAAEDVGTADRETRFLLPFVADIETDGDRIYAAVRRYERSGEQQESAASAGGGRRFESVVAAFDTDGTIRWRYRADASPISLAADADRVAVAYNRCPGDHQHGLVVLDAESGTPTTTWDPGTDGGRRVGDVALHGDGVVVASHGDFCGYRLDETGVEQWRLPLATPELVAGERVYAYPNHVHADACGAVFVTGNTYPEEGRETDARHPQENTAVGVTPGGEVRWRTDVGGFASGVGTDGDSVAVPGAQHFRSRTPESHGLTVLGIEGGQRRTVGSDGVVTAASLADGVVASIEEPVTYHDEERVRGTYRLRIVTEN